MGRTNPKLVPYLKQNLEMDSFINLRYEPGSRTVFYIELPRYEKDKCADFEAILKAWYDFNGKLHKYQGYSNGKSVFQAALKKSVYLMPQPNIGKRLRFRFASSEEIQENKRLLKEKEKNIHPPSPSNPPSVASSGYLSGNDSEAENMLLSDLQGDMWYDILSNPENYIGGDSGVLDDFLKDICLEDFKDLQPQNVPDSEAPQQNIQPEDFMPVDNLYQFMKPVTELKTTPVSSKVSDAVKKYWLCTQKIKVRGTLQLICELQVIEDGNSAIKEGLVVIPNDVFEPGVSYSLNKSFVLNDLKYFFFSPNTV